MAAPNELLINGSVSAMGYADPETRIGYGYVTSRMGMHLEAARRRVARGDPCELPIPLNRRWFPRRRSHGTMRSRLVGWALPEAPL